MRRFLLYPGLLLCLLGVYVILVNAAALVGSRPTSRSMTVSTAS